MWAPLASRLTLEIQSREGGEPRRLEMEREGEIHRIVAPDVQEGDLYSFVFPDGRKRPDPRSRHQPQGVHGPSAVVDLERLSRLAKGAEKPQRPFEDWVIYELHVGTFTEAGTFDAVIEKLPYLTDELGISAIELMPVSPFPGERNWGYDGVAPFGVQESYGGPEGLARLIHAAHERGVAMILDVVYNHLGPEGNYLREFGPYFTDRYETPWGDALNFDGDDSAQVRAWAVENAAQWVADFDFDGLRLDAVQMIHDHGPRHVVAEIGEAVQAAGGVVIAESDMNDPCTILPRPEGWGLDGQWSDDFHHALHAVITQERTGYYEDFGKASDVALTLERGFAYDGSRYSSFRQKWLGAPTDRMEAEQHVVCIQNHDQIGNRARGDRIHHIAGLEAAKVGGALNLLSPGTPMLFMGEEYAAPQRFPYFTSHGDPQVAKGVRKGRRHEFSAFEWQGKVPDPQGEATFSGAVLDLQERLQPPHEGAFRLYRELLSLRGGHQALLGPGRKRRLQVTAQEDPPALVMERWSEDGAHRLAVFCFFPGAASARELPLSEGRWRRLIDTGDAAFGGPGQSSPEHLESDAGVVRVEPHPPCLWVYEREG